MSTLTISVITRNRSQFVKKGLFEMFEGIKENNLILKSVHPSPLSASRGFFGNHHFSRANEYLIAHGKTPIEW